MSSQNTDLDRINSFAEWCKRAGISGATGRRLIAAGEGPQLTWLRGERGIMTDAGESDNEEPPELGPALQALPTDKQRRFVVALYDEEAPAKGDGLLIYAARTAGYGTATSTDKALSVMANRLVHDPRVRAAIAEYSHAVVRTIPPEAVKALKEVIRNPKHRDHMRAINAVIDRVDPLEHVVKVQDDRAPSVEETDRVLARIAELARRAGLPALAPPVDAEFSVVEAGR